MSTILILVRKDIANFLRNRTAVVLTFVVPIALIYVFGFVWGLNRKGSAGPQGIRLAVVNASADPAARELVDALKAENSFRVIDTAADGSNRPLTEADARAMIHDNQLRFAVVLPEKLIAGNGLGLNVKVLSNPQNAIEAQMVEGLLQKAIFSHLPQLLGRALQSQAKNYLGDASYRQFNHSIAAASATAFGGDPENIEREIEAGNFGFSQLGRAAEAKPATTAGKSKAETTDVFSNLLKIDREQLVGKTVKSPDATRVIGGQAIMFLLFALSNGAAAFFDEKNSGIFQRLLSAPVTRGQLLWSRFIFGTLLGLVQLTVLFLAGQALYGVDATGHLGNLLLVCAGAAAACTAFGMAIAAFTPNAQAASGIATLLVMIMSATGGAWFPPTFLPEFMVRIGKFTVVYWSMEGFTRVLWAENNLAQLLPTLGVLFGIGGGVMLLAIWRLNQKKIFG
jgi:ABC-2 type transport system permease protein